MKKLLILILFAVLLINLFNLNYCIAGSPLDSKVLPDMANQTNKMRESAGFSSVSETSLADIIALSIKAFLSLLGIIFVILIIYAGYVWMMAGGNETEVQKAKDTMRRAVIGLIITVSAYAITYFVFNYMPGVGAGGGTVQSGQGGSAEYD